MPMQMRLCVLASGSSGNCSALVIGEGDDAEVVLIDLGLSPRRTRKELAALGIDFARVRPLASVISQGRLGF